MSFEFANYTPAIGITFAIHPTSLFNRNETFSIQMVSVFSGAIAVVQNRVWRKAPSLAEWCESLDVSVVGCILLKQHSAHFLLPRFLERKYTWECANLPGRSLKVWQIRTVSRVFCEVFLAEASVLPRGIRMEVLRLTMTDGPQYLNALIAEMVSPRSEPPIVIPPFALVPAGQAHEIVIRHEDKSGMPSVVVQIADRAFGILERQLRELTERG
jgi:hypothetical protein